MSFLPVKVRHDLADIPNFTLSYELNRVGVAIS